MSARKKSTSKRRSPASVEDATERLAAIVEAAEQAASTVIDDAEQEARRRLEEAEARADKVIAERLRQMADEIDPPEQGEPSGRPRLRPVEAEAAPRSASAGPRLLATQMAVAGESRKDIAQRLRTEFEIEDPSDILDAILGPEE